MDEKKNTRTIVAAPPRHTGLVIFLVTFGILLYLFVSLSPAARGLSLLITLCLLSFANKDDVENATAVLGGITLVIGGLGGCVLNPILQESYVDSFLIGSLTSIWTCFVTLQVRMRMFYSSHLLL